MATSEHTQGWRRFSNGAGLKLVLVTLLVGLLSALLGMQDLLVRERQNYRNEAWNRTIHEWGGRQTVAGPILRIPVTYPVVNDRGLVENRVTQALILPQTMTADSRLTTETRTRGIYEVPLYTAKLSLSGAIAVDRDLSWLPPQATVQWSRAEIWFFVADARGLVADPTVNFGDRPLQLAPTIVPAGTGMPKDAFAARIGGVGNAAGPGASWRYRADFELRGGDHFGVFPAGADSQINLRSDWPAPEFGGEFLPTTRRIDAIGFEAAWRIPALARQLPTAGVYDTWNAFGSQARIVEVALTLPVDAYRMTERSVKYGLLFIIIPFVGLFLYEMLARIRLHPIQYLLIGLAVLVFYLLLLSLSERIGFGLAFALSAGTISSLLGVYCAAVLRGGKQGLFFAGGMAGLYGLLYLIVSSEDNALLVGSLLLFTLLAVAMMVTRRLDWYALGGPAKTKGKPGAAAPLT